MPLPRGEAIGGAGPPAEGEIGIGERWAWQLPAYRGAFRRLLAESGKEAVRLRPQRLIPM